ncbi:MAG: hypothetical protein HQL59_02305 [Magnetococcales bacterium]|nr:hypothetical protein [Magnetococcales bacterium]
MQRITTAGACPKRIDFTVIFIDLSGQFPGSFAVGTQSAMKVIKTAARVVRSGQQDKKIRPDNIRYSIWAIFGQETNDACTDW